MRWLALRGKHYDMYFVFHVCVIVQWGEEGRKEEDGCRSRI